MDFVGNINFDGLDPLEKCQEVIVAYVKSHTDAEVFRGSGWADTLFPNLGLSKEILDAIVPDRPIALASYDGHSLWVNSLTLDRALIRKDTPDPDGNYAFSRRKYSGGCIIARRDVES